MTDQRENELQEIAKLKALNVLWDAGAQNAGSRPSNGTILPETFRTELALFSVVENEYGVEDGGEYSEPPPPPPPPRDQEERDYINWFALRILARQAADYQLAILKTYHLFVLKSPAARECFALMHSRIPGVALELLPRFVASALELMTPGQNEQLKAEMNRRFDEMSRHIDTSAKQTQAKVGAELGIRRLRPTEAAEMLYRAEVQAGIANPPKVESLCRSIRNWEKAFRNGESERNPPGYPGLDAGVERFALFCNGYARARTEAKPSKHKKCQLREEAGAVDFEYPDN